MVITGGTEAGHTSHGYGKPILDFRFNPELTKYLRDNKVQAGVAKVCTAPEDAAFRVNCATNEQHRHLHVEIIN